MAVVPVENRFESLPPVSRCAASGQFVPLFVGEDQHLRLDTILQQTHEELFALLEWRSVIPCRVDDERRSSESIMIVASPPYEPPMMPRRVVSSRGSVAAATSIAAAKSAMSGGNGSPHLPTTARACASP